jgi:hypothetical protein
MIILPSSISAFIRYIANSSVSFMLHSTSKKVYISDAEVLGVQDFMGAP